MSHKVGIPYHDTDLALLRDSLETAISVLRVSQTPDAKYHISIIETLIASVDVLRPVDNTGEHTMHTLTCGCVDIKHYIIDGYNGPYVWECICGRAVNHKVDLLTQRELDVYLEHRKAQDVLEKINRHNDVFDDFDINHNAISMSARAAAHSIFIDAGTVTKPLDPVHIIPPPIHKAVQHQALRDRHMVNLRTISKECTCSIGHDHYIAEMDIEEIHKIVPDQEPERITLNAAPPEEVTVIRHLSYHEQRPNVGWYCTCPLAEDHPLYYLSEADAMEHINSDAVINGKPDTTTRKT